MAFSLLFPHISLEGATQQPWEKGVEMKSPGDISVNCCWSWHKNRHKNDQHSQMALLAKHNFRYA